MWCLSRIRLDPEILDPAGSGYQPDPDILDPTGSGSQPDPQFLEIRTGSTKFTGYPAGSGSGCGSGAPPVTPPCEAVGCRKHLDIRAPDEIRTHRTDH